MRLKTDYFGHDSKYKKRKVEGQQGWATAEEVDEFHLELEKILKSDYVPKEGKLLELGCGDGANLIWLAKKGYEVYGIDIAPTAIEWAKEKIKNQNIEADFRIGNVLDLKEFEDNFFDLVLDGHCFHCIIGEDREDFLRNALRVLKPDGIFIVSTMCGDVTHKEMKKYFDTESRCLVYGDLATRYIGLPEDIIGEIRTAGFNIVNFTVQPKKNQNDCDTLWAVAMK
jgi:2-polyprenyl-3-methyl-5-hydroxy-6-metoxy-1,4-benzoquinol methylase